MVNYRSRANLRKGRRRTAAGLFVHPALIAFGTIQADVPQMRELSSMGLCCRRMAAALGIAILGLAGCSRPAESTLALPDEPGSLPEGAEIATFGGGCFWCVEEAFHQQKGVISAVSGYMGGTAEEANYEAVCSGRTAHAEVVQIAFDPEVASYAELLDLFFLVHDPTTINRQGNDVGPQYRSVIFYHSEAQKEEAEAAIRALNGEAAFGAPVVTAVEKAAEFYVAEEKHQDYYRRNPDDAYCRAVIRPKLKKLGLEY
ncbi:MAG TPA: peptide-methionine (S)-S-oxide reductase MsrA [Verrucomicrobiales bacterium]|nr:peptide-methionine (S)-S-oxide reductase MsrA [Verrucomicrobiales bacterium]